MQTQVAVGPPNAGVSEMAGWLSGGKASEQDATGSTVPGSFLIGQDLRERLRESLRAQDQNVDRFYHQNGIFQHIARNRWFEQITLAVIGINAIWIAVEVDWNKRTPAGQSVPVLKVMDNVFCIFFSVEWFVRFMAFKSKVNTLRDQWFVFDSVLVLIMVLETWVLLLIEAVTSINGSEGFGNLSVLRILRLLRLTRMAKVMRKMPELMVLVKGLLCATRSVMLTLLLLVILVYVFAIVFTQITEGTSVGDESFKSVPFSMYTLGMQGILPDMGEMMTELVNESWFLGAIFFLFGFLATLTLINMLIGILCEVVTNVSEVEKENMDRDMVWAKMRDILSPGGIDADNDGKVSRDEFLAILQSPGATRALHQVGVDITCLVDHADFIFQGELGEDGEVTEKVLTLEEFVETVMQLRRTNKATVRDVSELRKLFHTRLAGLEASLCPGGVGVTKGKPSSHNGSPKSSSRAPFQGMLDRPYPPADFTADQGSSKQAPGFPDISADSDDHKLEYPESPAELQELRDRISRLEGLVLQVLQMQGVVMDRLNQAEPSARSSQHFGARVADPSVDVVLKRTTPSPMAACATGGPWC